MPIATFQNDGYTDNLNSVPINKNPYRTATVYGDDNSITAITAISDGSPWTVDYYAQLIDSDSQVSTPDLNTDITTLQYTKINKLILYVIEPINPAYTDSEGVSYIHSGITPNINDIIKATLYDNRVSLLLITNVEYTTRNNTKRYKITYKPIYYLDIDSAIFDTINNQTVREYWYDKGGEHPLLLKDEYYYKTEVTKAVPYLTEIWLSVALTGKSFIHIPNRYNEIIVDPYLEDFVYKTMSIDDSDKWIEMTRLNILGDIPKVTTIYEVLITRNIRLLDILDRKTTVQYTKRPHHPIMTKYGHIGVDKLVMFDEVGDFITKSPLPQETLPNNITTYLFSDNFYNGYGVLSDMEQIVYDYLGNKEIDFKHILKIIDDMNNWGSIDKYYYIPILIFICKRYINNLTTYI